MKSIALLLVVGLLGCIGPQASEHAYFELIRESPGVAGSASFTEYIVFSTGLIIEKKEYDGNASRTEMNAFRADGKEALALLTLAKALPAASEQWACEDCDSYQLFVLDGQNTRKAFFNASNAPEAVKDLEAKTTALLQNRDAGFFFVKLVQQKIGGPIVDYHIAGDGLVLYEEFGRGPGDIITSRIYTVEKEKIAGIKQSAEPAKFTKQGLEGCLEKGLVYGYVEAVKDNGYGFAYTCGGKTPEGRLFDFIKNSGVLQ